MCVGERVFVLMVVPGVFLGIDNWGVFWDIDN